jgi:CRISPR/Cas system-associated exonuclease Cas4 (RecB family)
MFDFDKLLEKHIAREHKPKKIGKYYPSEVGNCLRKVWYSYKYPQAIDINKQKIFELGSMIHAFVIDVLKSTKNEDIKLLKYEFPFDMRIDKFQVSGRVDDLLLLKVENKKLLVEVKSCKNVEAVKKPHFNHRLQLQFYMYATGVHEGAMLYVDKNNLQSKVFPVDFDRQEAEKIVGRFRLLHTSLVSNRLPPAEGMENEEMKGFCKYCEYVDKCKQDES